MRVQPCKATTRAIPNTKWSYLFATAVCLSMFATARAAQPALAGIKIGNTMPYSGPLSSYGIAGRLEAAYFRMLNEQGGINGRPIEFISLDDGYNPSKTVEQTRRLVESDNVLLMFGAFGTLTVSAVQKYLAEQKVPQLFFVTGASKWEDRGQHSWMIGWQPTYRGEGRILANYILRTQPQAKIGVLYQDDDYGKDYLRGLKDGLGDKAATMIVSELSYQVSDPTIDSIKASGANVFFDASTAKFAAQAIRRAYEIGWRPLHLLNSVSSAVGSVLKPAGLDKSVGVISAAYIKDPTDSQFSNDPDVRDYLAFMQTYFPEGDVANVQNVTAYARAMTLVEVLRQCQGDLSRENILRQAGMLDLALPMLLPGIRIRTAGDRPSAITQMQLQRFDGRSWERFGDLIETQQRARAR